jgi:hypothetical protein
MKGSKSVSGRLDLGMGRGVRVESYINSTVMSFSKSWVLSKVSLYVP